MIQHPVTLQKRKSLASAYKHTTDVGHWPQLSGCSQYFRRVSDGGQPAARRVDSGTVSVGRMECDKLVLRCTPDGKVFISYLRPTALCHVPGFEGSEDEIRGN